ncbi:SMC-Scp complex subunit ScpB [Candidatus Parcubacteria bacterium]|nr:SMC-Scp complex subunit ScpB [Candidatus Parcubacteria bacterium]
MNTANTIEAVLFFYGEPLSVKKLASLLDKSEEEIKEALGGLKASLQGRGLTLLEKDEEIALGTVPEASSVIEKLVKEEFHRDIGKAGLEALSLVIYYGPISRADIDYVRGVSSHFILRNLLLRGLVEKIENPEDKRSFLYRPTFDLLGHLGVSSVEELPEYAEVRAEIAAKMEALKTTPTENNAERE